MSKIEWTDATVNVQIGCSRVSPGCEHCYAETQANSLARRFGEPGQVGHRYLKVVDGKGRWSRKVAVDLDALARPPHGATPFGHGIPQRKRDGDGWRRPRVFLGSMTDHFHEKVTPTSFDMVIEWMAKGPSVVWQLVTKRPERATELLQRVRGGMAVPWPTIHLLATVEDQQRADERIHHLLRAKPHVDLVGLSVEPLLGPVVLPTEALEQLGWVIVGGESGKLARPCDVAWVRSIVTQCRAAGVPCFVKQLGARPVTSVPPREMGDEGWPNSVGAYADVDGPTTVCLTRKGGDWTEWPEDLRIREWPS